MKKIVEGYLWVRLSLGDQKLYFPSTFDLRTLLHLYIVVVCSSEIGVSGRCLGLESRHDTDFFFSESSAKLFIHKRLQTIYQSD